MLVVLLLLRGWRWGSGRKEVAGRGVGEGRVAVDMMMLRGDCSGIYTRRYARPVHGGRAGRGRLSGAWGSCAGRRWEVMRTQGSGRTRRQTRAGKAGQWEMGKRKEQLGTTALTVSRHQHTHTIHLETISPPAPPQSGGPSRHHLPAIRAPRKLPAPRVLPISRSPPESLSGPAAVVKPLRGCPASTCSVCFRQSVLHLAGTHSAAPITSALGKCSFAP